MRKADYATLARIIRETREHYANPKLGDGHATQAVEAVEHVARAFADAASVDRAAFLKACGIE